MKKLLVQTATTVQTAIPALKKEEKTLYYLVIGEGENQVVINIGEKTYKSVKALVDAAPKSSDEIKKELEEANKLPNEGTRLTTAK